MLQDNYEVEGPWNAWAQYHDTWIWDFDNSTISTSRPIVEQVRRQIRSNRPLHQSYINHYPMFYGEQEFRHRDLHFDVSLHLRLIQHLLSQGQHDDQRVLLALMAEVGLPLGLKVRVIGRQSLEMHGCPRLMHRVQWLTSIGNPTVCKRAPPNMWFACRLDGCRRVDVCFSQVGKLEGHLRDFHRLTATEVFEVFRDPANAQLRTRFGPFTTHILERDLGIDVSRLRPQRRNPQGNRPQDDQGGQQDDIDMLYD